MSYQEYDDAAKIEGALLLNTPVTAEQAAYLWRFSEIRHMARDPQVNLAPLVGKDMLHDTVGLLFGEEGCHYVGTASSHAKEIDEYGVIDCNRPPVGVPSLWAPFDINWAPFDIHAETPDLLVWNRAEKFVSLGDWLDFYIKHFFKPWGLQLNGVLRVKLKSKVLSTIRVSNNVVTETRTPERKKK